MPPFDLRRYGAVREFLQDRQQRDEGEARDRTPSWMDATNEWVREELGLDGDALDYFIYGVNMIVGGVHAKTRHWLSETPQPHLDEEIWLFARAWLDHYGPLYPTRPAF